MTKTFERKGSLLILNGLDISKPGEYIADGASPNLQNFYLDRGVLTKRPGTTEIGSTQSEEIMAGRQFIRESSNLNVRIGLDEIRRYNSGTDAWDDITGTDLTGSTSDLIDTAVPLLSGKAILCITNGIDAIRKYVGTGNTSDLGGSPPKAKFIQEYKTYLVAAHILGGTDIGQRIQWSDTADPEEWSTGNSGALDLIEDGEITGMSLFGGYLAVHKLNAIYLGQLVSSSAIFQFDRIPTGTGTVCNNTIQNLPTGEHIFLAADGLRIFNGQTAPLIESPINEEIRDSINSEYVHKSWSVLSIETDEVWFGIPIGSQETGDTVYRFNYKTRTILKDVRSNITCAWRWSNTSTETWDDSVGTWDEQIGRWNDGSQSVSAGLIMLGDNTGSTHKIDSSATSDSGESINAIFESKDYTLDSQVMGRWQEVELFARGTECTVEYSINAGETWQEFSGSPVTLGSVFPTDFEPNILYMDELSTLFRIKITNNGNTDSIAIKQFLISVLPWGMRNG